MSVSVVSAGSSSGNDFMSFEFDEFSDGENGKDVIVLPNLGNYTTQGISKISQ